MIRTASKRAVTYLSLWMLVTSSFSALASSYLSAELAAQPVISHADKAKEQPIPAQLAEANRPVLAAHDSLDFEVQSISHRRFRISFNNRSGKSIFVKIYDVIGNLIKQEKINRKGEFKKDYDMSDTHTEFYVIEVGNTQTTVVKRLFPTEATAL